jgi:hypothetical protein
MNKPYTCHNCSTVFDALPDEAKELIEHSKRPFPAKVTVKCPGCYGNGYTDVAEMIYVLDISGTATLVA